MPGGGSPQGTSSTTPNLSPEQRQLLSAGMPLVQQTTDAVTSGAAKIPTPAGFDPLQTQGQGQVAAASGAGGSMDQLANSAASSNKFLNNATDFNSNPYIQDYISSSNKALDQAYRTQVIPGLRTSAEKAGALGGSRDTMGEDLAAQTYLRQRGDQTTNILNAAYGAGLGATASGVSLAPSTARGMTLPGATTEAVGAEKQDLANQIAQAGFNQQLLPLDLATQLFSSLSGLPTAQTTNTTPAQPTSLIGRMFS